MPMSLPAVEPTSLSITTARGRLPLGRCQRALLRQWQAFGYLAVFLGVFTAVFITGGSSVLAGFALLMSIVLFEPLVLSAASAREHHYRLASSFGMLGAAIYGVLSVCMLIATFAAGSPLTLVPLGAESIAGAVVLMAAAAATFDASRALWAAPPGPALVHGGTRRQAMEAISAHAGKRAESQGPDRLS
jgi:hypothetical protein